MDKIVEEKINSLDVSEKWKDKFKAISEAGPIGDIPKPKFENEARYKELPFFTKYNLWGFFFTWLYYLLKGMPKKGISIFLLAVFLQVLAENLHAGQTFFAILSILLPAGVGFAHSNIDYYRTKVLKEDFWW